MLQFFRNMFKSKIGAAIALLVLALIAFAFVSGDLSNTGNLGLSTGGSKVATVGSERIDANALSQAATNAVENVKQQDPTQSMQAFLAAGGLDRVLDDMIDRAALAAFGKSHGVIASDRLIDSEIANIPAFKGPDGKFSETIFRQMMQQRGVSEELVRGDLAQGLISRQLLTPASYGAVAPRETALRYAALLREKRSGAIALLPSALFAPKTPPTDAQLTAFYTQKRSRFIRPERRVIRYATFGDEALKTVAPPTEAEIAAGYNANKAQYAALETRQVTQLIVPTEAAARAVADEVAKGKSLEAAASAKGLSAARLGAIGKAALAGQSSPAVADAVFAAAKGAIAAPARSGLGWHVMRVDGIDLRAARPLDSVRGELTTQIAATKRRQALNDLSARLEDEFDKGGNLTEAAKELGVTLQETGPLTADGGVYGQTGAHAPAILGRTLQTAFAMEENAPQLAEVEPGKTFLIFDVKDIAPSAPAPLAEIKQDVTVAYMLDKGAAAAKIAADKVQAEMRKGATLQAAMATLGVQLPPAQPIDMDRTQLTAAGRQPPPPLMLLFSMAEGTVKTLAAPGEQGWFIVSLKDIVPFPVQANDPVLPIAQKQLGQLAGAEYAQQLRRAISAEVGVKRNDAGIKAVRTQLGGGGN